jgi:hypothetical protein
MRDTRPRRVAGQRAPSVRIRGRRLARVGLFDIPLVVWTQGVIALAMWGWSIGATIKVLAR